MNRNEIMTEWVRRLRSGEYEQTTNYLNRDGKMCCLGVLCEIAKEQCIVTTETTSNVVTDVDVTRYISVADTFDQDVAALPKAVSRWADIPPNGHFAYDVKNRDDVPVRNTDGLASMNDEGFPFSKIADIIEWKVQDSSWHR